MWKRLVTPIIVVSILLSGPAANASSGDIDQSFPPEGSSHIGLARFGGAGEIDQAFFNAGQLNVPEVTTLVRQPDGKLLVGGCFTSFAGKLRGGILRLETNGSLDEAFDPGIGFDDCVQSIALDGSKIVVGGSFTHFGASSRGHIARLNADGTLDESFDASTGFDNTVRAVAVDAAHDVVVSGPFRTFVNNDDPSLTPVPAPGIARLRTSGSDVVLDAGFAPVGFAASGEKGYAILIDADGKIVIGGDFHDYGGPGGPNAIVRLTDAGVLDDTFAVGTGFDNSVHALAFDPNGNIVVGGRFGGFGTPGTQLGRIARLSNSGVLDANFAPLFHGDGFDGDVNSISVSSDGKMIVGGNFGSYRREERRRLIRLKEDGLEDFSGDGFTPAATLDAPVNAVSVSPDGKEITVGGSFTARVVSGAYGEIDAMVRQPDGKLIIAGDALTRYGGVKRQHIARINADGSLDETFDPAFALNAGIGALALQPDGKILIGGNSFTSLSGAKRRGIARLNADGTFDESFDPQGAGTSESSNDDDVTAIMVQPDDKILIGGNFNSYDGVDHNGIARLNKDGSLDAEFDVGGAQGVGLYDKNSPTGMSQFALQSDGKIIIVGKFNTYDNDQAATFHRGVMRLNTDGSYDATFDKDHIGRDGFGTNSGASAVAIQPDGRIVIGGTIDGYDGPRVPYGLARLNADGTLDTTFDPGASIQDRIASVSVRSLALQPDGKILAGGDFRTYDGTALSSLVRVDASGKRDAAFDTTTSQGAGFTGDNDRVNALVLQPDGHVVVAGRFYGYGTPNVLTRNNILRLDAGASARAPGVIVSKSSLSVSETGTSDTFTVRLNSAPTADVQFDLVSSATDEAIVAPSTLTFTSANWDTPQTVTVTGVDDKILDGTQTAQITISVQGIASAPEYVSVPDTVITASTLDDEVAPPTSGGGGGSVAQSITLNAPNGGEVLHAGEVKNVSWTYRGAAPSAVRLELSTDGGSTYSALTQDAGANGLYAWTVPDVSTFSAKLRVSMLQYGSPVASDDSDAAFSILGSGLDGLPRTGSGTGTAPVFIPSASIDEDKGLTASGTGTPACAAGSLVRTAELSAVYYCGADAKRYVFPNEKVFFSWYADFSKVQVVSPAVLSSLPIGGNVTYKPGTRLLKVESDPKTYLVSRKGVLRWIKTEQDASKLYGASWSKKVDDLPVSLFTDYSVGEAVTGL